MNLFVSTTLIYLIHCANDATAVKSTVPVFMIDYEQVMAHVHIDPNPFAKMTHTKFAEIINDSADRSTGIVIFVEETFSVEDISKKDVLYGTPFKNLHATLEANRETLKYFPSVIDPFTVLQKIFPRTRSNVHYLSQNSKLRLKDNFKHLYIFFTDGPKESKTDILRRHDTVIKEILSAARRLKAGPVLAYYTGKQNPVVVEKVEYVENLPNESKSRVLLVSPLARVQITGIHLHDMQTRRAVPTGTPTVARELKTEKHQLTAWSLPDFDLEWEFKFEPNFWRIDNIIMYEGGGKEEVGRVFLNVQCPYNRSYYCPEPVQIYNTNTQAVITFNEIMVEPKGELNSTAFNPAIHCTPYFNGPILSCLFVSFTLLGITLYGVMMISDCSPNDRYEDPDSKPLVHETMH